MPPKGYKTPEESRSEMESEEAYRRTMVPIVAMAETVHHFLRQSIAGLGPYPNRYTEAQKRRLIELLVEAGNIVGG